VHWEGYCTLTAHPEDRRPCTAENVSREGVLLLLDEVLAVREGQTLMIDLERIGSTPVKMRVRGTVRHVVSPTSGGGTQIGVHLVFETRDEQRVAKMLFSN
jgi:hypothetical protein